MGSMGCTASVMAWHPALAWHGTGMGMGMGWHPAALASPAPIDGTWRAYVRSHFSLTPPKKIRIL